MLSVIIVTRNSAQFLKSCIGSLRAQDFQDFETIVVDNASCDDTATFLKERYPRARLIRNNINLGAAQARNQGIGASTGAWVLTLDCDVVLEGDFIRKALARLNGIPDEVGVIQPKILCADKISIYSCGIHVSWLKRFFDIGSNHIDRGQFDVSRYVCGACAAAALYRREMLEAVKDAYGYFDQRLFFLAEDVDLALRARALGWKALYLPEARCYHAGGSSGLGKKIRQYLCWRNRRLLLKKCSMPFLQAALAAALYDVPRGLLLFFSNTHVRNDILGRRADFLNEELGCAKKINILYIITKLELGGAQKQLLSLIRQLDKEEYAPYLFTARDGLLAGEALSINGLKVQLSDFLERPIHPLKDIFSLFEIYRYIVKNDIHIVHTHSSKAGLLGRVAARLARVKVIIHTVHGWSFNNFQPFPQRKLFILLERFAARFTHALIVVSEYDLQKGLSSHIGTRGRYAVIRYGITHEEFQVKNPVARRALGIRDSDTAVGMISCFKPQKSPQDFVRLAHLVAQVVPSAKFILVGDGILRNSIEKLIHAFNLDDRVVLTGWRRDIPAILSAIDVCVLTSLWEGLPITALEAMAAGCVVVATHTGGISEIIHEGETGFLVKPGDMKNMADKVVLLLRDPQLRNVLANNAKRHLGDEFRLENMIKKSQHLYNSLVGEGRERPW